MIDRLLDAALDLISAHPIAAGVIVSCLFLMGLLVTFMSRLPDVDDG